VVDNCDSIMGATSVVPAATAMFGEVWKSYREDVGLVRFPCPHKEYRAEFGQEGSRSLFYQQSRLR